jgi:hypothetical protein
VFDAAAAAVMGLAKGTICVMIHSGSRGLGHQVGLSGGRWCQAWGMLQSSTLTVNIQMSTHSPELPDLEMQGSMCSLALQVG